MIALADARERAPQARKGPSPSPSPAPPPPRHGDGEAPDVAQRRAAMRAARLVERGIISPLEAERQVRLAGYSAAKPSEFRRVRTGLGGEADSHLGSELDYWRVREYVRDMDRNDAIPGPLTDRAVTLCLGTGVAMDPQTGQARLDAEIRRRWTMWGEDPFLFDAGAKWDFATMERLGLRHAFLDGDAFGVPQNEGPRAGRVQFLEGDRIAGSDATGKVLHGIEQDLELGNVVAYHALKRRPDTRRFSGFRVPAFTSENYLRIPAFDEDGRPRVWHILDPRRATQGRGITRFRGVFDELGMWGDILYAATEAHQVAACIPAFITSSSDVLFGPRETRTEQRGLGSSTTPSYEELAPGTIPRLRPGEAISGVTGAGPPPNLAEHLRLLGRVIALALDLPYTLAFLDTGPTTFHGYRGELDQAKRAARWVQRWYPNCWHRPMYAWWLRRELPALVADGFADEINAADRERTLFRVRPQPPAWPYVEPKTDAEADILRVREGLGSPRQILGEGGRDFDDTVDEAIADRASAIRKAEAERLKLASEGIEVGLERLLPALLWPTATAAGAPLVPTKPPAPAPVDMPAEDMPEDGQDPADAEEVAHDEA